MRHDVHIALGNVRLVVSSLRIDGQLDEESDYIAHASEIDGHGHSPPICLSKPGSATAALDLATRDPWVVEHAGLSA
jgi:hypothetical protein